MLRATVHHGRPGKRAPGRLPSFRPVRFPREVPSRARDASTATFALLVGMPVITAGACPPTCFRPKDSCTRDGEALRLPVEPAGRTAVLGTGRNSWAQRLDSTDGGDSGAGPARGASFRRE